MLNDLQNNAESAMQNSVESLKHELAKVRTGRAHPSLLESIKVSYYEQLTPLSQIASIVVEDPRTLSVTPWEKSMVIDIDKAIRSSGMDLNPVAAGSVIRVPLPILTEETRKNLVRKLGGIVENSRVSVRNARRDANSKLKDLLKNKEISEDEERRSQDNIQKLTDKYIAEVDKLFAAKEADVMSV